MPWRLTRPAIAAMVPPDPAAEKQPRSPHSSTVARSIARSGRTRPPIFRTAMSRSVMPEARICPNGSRGTAGRLPTGTPTGSTTTPPPRVGAVSWQGHLDLHLRATRHMAAQSRRRSVMNVLFPPPADPSAIRLRVLSLGAGVQSTTLALMAAHGEITPMPIALSSPIPAGSRRPSMIILPGCARRTCCRFRCMWSRTAISATGLCVAHAVSTGPQSRPLPDPHPARSA